MRFKAKPLRSVMFVPGNREDWMRKAHQYGLGCPDPGPGGLGARG